MAGRKQPLKDWTLLSLASSGVPPSLYCSMGCCLAVALVLVKISLPGPITSTAVSESFFFFFFFFLRRVLALSPRLECSCEIMAHCSLNLLGRSDPPTSISQTAGTAGAFPNPSSCCCSLEGRAE
uniref:Uncharacterized protein n=1 Tax=Theropithecus gelada TaxID=9565 RepID=A0A8D2ETD7_THEGE